VPPLGPSEGRGNLGQEWMGARGFNGTRLQCTSGITDEDGATHGMRLVVVAFCSFLLRVLQVGNLAAAAAHHGH
jgi:hypothetical protein